MWKFLTQLWLALLKCQASWIDFWGNARRRTGRAIPPQLHGWTVFIQMLTAAHADALSFLLSCGSSQPHTSQP